MTFRKIADIIINVLLPLILGYIIYNVSFENHVKNYLPDGLWAYSFVSALSIIWKRHLPLFWIVTVFIIAALVEYLQLLKVIPGTADIIDIVVYFIFIIIGLLINRYKNNLTLHQIKQLV